MPFDSQGWLDGCERLPGLSTLRAPVKRLLAGSSPAAIAGAVRPGIIASIKASPLWFLPHIFKKSQEVSSPTFANNDASSAVIGIILRPRISASLIHCTPDVIRAIPRLAVAMICFKRRGGEIGALLGSGVMASTQTSPVHGFIAAFYKAYLPCLGQIVAAARQRFANVATLAPALPMHPAQATAKMAAALTAFDRASVNGNLSLHREPVLSGVTGQDVDASLPSYFTRKRGAIWA